MTLESDIKFEEKLTFGKSHEELGLWWETFIQSKKRMSLKFVVELCVMTMKNDARFEEKLTCRFEIDTTI